MFCLASATSLVRACACAGEGANFTLAQVAAIVMIWAGAFCVTCLAPMRLYTSARCVLS